MKRKIDSTNTNISSSSSSSNLLKSLTKTASDSTSSLSKLSSKLMMKDDDTITPELFKAFNEKTIDFIIHFTQKLNLVSDRIVIATATTYLHRFFELQSMKQHDRFVIGLACVFLACKVEEQPRHIKDIISHYFNFRFNSKHPGSELYLQMMDSLVAAERILLQTLSFDLEVIHPYTHLMTQLRSIKGYIPKERLKEFTDTSRSFINDSFVTKLCLKYSPQYISASCMLLASQQIHLDLIPPGKSKTNNSDDYENWQELIINELDIDWSSLNEICNNILDIYEDGYGKYIPKEDKNDIKK